MLSELRWSLLRWLKGTAVLVCILEIVDDFHKRKICVANTHLSSNFELPQIQLFQLKTLLAEVKSMASPSLFVLVGDLKQFLVISSRQLHSSRMHIRNFTVLQTFARCVHDDIQWWCTEGHRLFEWKTPLFWWKTIVGIQQANISKWYLQCTVCLCGVVQLIISGLNAILCDLSNLLDTLTNDTGHINLRNFTLPDAEHPSDHLTYHG